ncbi:MAG: type II secretion system protein, partial [Clostridia bacterium]|nr:type II secretion system protein [Clostridia bacterium]
MNKYKRNKHGFTLVELIVVLVILAILAAILVPALTGYIDKAREKTAISQCRACVQAAQTLASERHTSSSPLSLADADQILTLAEVKGQGEITTLTINKDSSAVDKLVWKAANGIVVTYENKQYVIGKASGLAGSNLALSDLISNMATTLTAANPTFSPQSVVDSTSPNGQKKTALLNNPDIKSILESANATSWKLAEKGVCLYLSDQDI